MVCLKCVKKVKTMKEAICLRCGKCGKFAQSFVFSDKYNMFVCDSMMIKDGCETY